MRQRKSPRLKGYDYTQKGAYFVTICTHQRQPLFGKIITDGLMQLSSAGEIAFARWDALPEHHSSVQLDAFVVMPNHVHGILLLMGSEHSESATELGRVIGAYKSGVTRRIREALHIPDMIVWQGRYHDHIIRNERGLNTIRQYIHNNPKLWSHDVFYDP
jgi:REP element-mobilizing transposase RayT